MSGHPTNGETIVAAGGAALLGACCGGLLAVWCRSVSASSLAQGAVVFGAALMGACAGRLRGAAVGAVCGGCLVAFCDGAGSMSGSIFLIAASATLGGWLRWTTAAPAVQPDDAQPAAWPRSDRSQQVPWPFLPSARTATAPLLREEESSRCTAVSGG